MEALVTIVVLMVLGVVLFALTPFKKFVVEAHERGVLFKNGRFITQFEAADTGVTALACDLRPLTFVAEP